MKIALVHGKYFNSWEALGLGYIAAYLKKHISDIDLRFYQGCFDDEEIIVKNGSECDIVIFSCTTPTFRYANEISRRIKELNPKTRIVVGGYHPSAAPMLSLNENIDQIVVGEGEEAMLEIVRGNTERIVNGRIMDFDKLPWPDRRLIKNERNIMVAYKDTGKRITSFQSHRACPFMCKYCLDGFNKVLYGNAKKAPVRYRSIRDLLDEMEFVTKEFRLDLVKFCDPTWNTNVKWVVEFCKEKIKRGFAIPFYPNIHAGVCDDEMFNLMAKAGCCEIAIGIESGSPKILKQIGKGTTIESIRRAVKRAKTAGILIRGYFLLGMPEEGREEIRETEKFAEELDLDEYGFTILCPYPGTQLYNSQIHGNVDWEAADEYSNDFWRTKYLSNTELKEWQQKLIAKFKKKITWHNKVI